MHIPSMKVGGDLPLFPDIVKKKRVHYQIKLTFFHLICIIRGSTEIE
jgi:hypothetical protein